MNKASTVNDNDCEMESSLHSCIEYFRGRELFKKGVQPTNHFRGKLL